MTTDSDYKPGQGRADHALCSSIRPDRRHASATSNTISYRYRKQIARQLLCRKNFGQGRGRGEPGKKSYPYL